MLGSLRDCIFFFIDPFIPLTLNCVVRKRRYPTHLHLFLEKIGVFFGAFSTYLGYGASPIARADDCDSVSLLVPT